MRAGAFFVVVLLGGGCAHPATSPAPTRVTQESGDIRSLAPEPTYPEGVAYDPASDAFFVSSIRRGTIGRVTRDGRYEVFSSDPALVSSCGLWVAVMAAPRKSLRSPRGSALTLRRM